jgi:hypothetical protein
MVEYIIAFTYSTPSLATTMSTDSVYMNDLPRKSLVDDVLCVLQRVAGLGEKDINKVEHGDGWCTWPELLSVPGIDKARDYYDYGWLFHFVVLGDDWMLTFDRNRQDEYYSKWAFASTKMTTDRHAVPELGTLFGEA